jgi:60S ribosomal subunit assembly/export protein LOC1
MAPIKPSKGGKSSLGKAASKSSSKSSSKPAFKPKKVGTVSPAGKNKPKRTSGPVKKKKRVYTEKELGIPTLNGIVPAGVQKVKGKKKGKVFVDDQESMMTILAIVNAEKEGQIESKMIKAVSCISVLLNSSQLIQNAEAHGRNPRGTSQ